MLRRLHRKLRLIRYYSATQRSTAWSRAIDIALVVTLVAAYPAAWAADVTVVRSTESRSASGVLARDAEGALHASTSDDVAWLIETPGLKQAGRFKIAVDLRRNGWPLATSILRERARVDVDLLAEPAARPNADLAPDDPVRIAIEQELVRTGESVLLAAWGAGDPTAGRSVRWLVFAAAGLMWWVMLFLVAVVGIQTTRALHLSHRRQEQRQELERVAVGYCGACGYDLRGLDFNERCPECGGLV